VLLTVYLYGWLITSIVAVVAIQNAHAAREMQLVHRGLLVVVAGLVWPALVIGGVQYVVIALLSRVIGAGSLSERDLVADEETRRADELISTR
jgi:hypothetical protein